MSTRTSELLTDPKKRVRTAGVALLLVVIILAGLSLWKPVPMQAIAGGVSFLAVCALAYITWLHVLSNEQLARTNQAILKTLSDDSYAFGLRQDGPNAILWIANLGHAHLMLHGLYMQSGEAQSAAAYSEIVQAGHVVELNVTKQLLELPRGVSDIDVWFEFVSASGSAISSVQGYNVLVANGLVCRVRAGAYQPRNVDCPRCGRAFSMMVMGINNPGELEARSAEFRSELETSCPEHSSQWLLKTEMHAEV